MRCAPVLLIALVAAGCGYTGDPLPPALNIPQKINDLGGLQRGSTIVVAFTPTLMSTDQILLKEFRSIELRVGPIPEGEFNLDGWLRGSRAIDDVPAKAERTEVEFPATDLVGKPVVVAVRAIGPTGRPADWSNFLTLRVVEPPQTPIALKAASNPRGALLQWDGGQAPDGATWRVFRLGPGDKAAQLTGTVNRPEWIDPSVQEGQEYTYSVQLLVPSGTGEAESKLSDIAKLKPEDVFAPAIPANLEGITGVNTIELTWERSPDEDTAGYVLFRALGDVALERYAGPIADPSFSDSKVEPGKLYRYAVAAVDRKGNASPPSEPIKITAP